MQLDAVGRLEEGLQRGDFDRVIRDAYRHLLTPGLQPRYQAVLHRLAGGARGRSGDPYGALKPLEMAISLALKSKDWDTLGLARADLGIAWLTAGDLPNAIDTLQSYFIDAHRYQGALKVLGHVHYNLALAYGRRRDFQAAVPHYQEAVHVFKDRNQPTLLCMAQQNLAWLFCMAGTPYSAEQELAKCESLSQECGQPYQSQQLVCRAFQLEQTQRVGDAMKLVEELLWQRAPEPAHRGYASWIAGKVALRLRQYDHAGYYADLAIRWGLDAMDPGIMSLASNLKADIAQLTTQKTEAAG